MQWYNQPANWSDENNRIKVHSDPKTDFWRKTHYGFIRDNGHFYCEAAQGEFVATVKITGRYADLYDQAGLMLRADETTWIKCGIEYVDGVQYASAVVTREFSDWSVLPLDPAPASLWLRVTRQGGDVQVEYSLDGDAYRMLRMAHLGHAGPLQAGIMCASPEGAGFDATFEEFAIRSI